MSQVYDIMIHVYIHAAHWRQDWILKTGTRKQLSIGYLYILLWL